MTADRWWHGSSRIDGEWIEPPNVTGRSRSGETVDRVFVTSDRDLAATYAASVDGTGWIYEVEPSSPPMPVASLVTPDAAPISFTTDRARIVRRFTLPKAEQLKRRAAMGHAHFLAAT